MPPKSKKKKGSHVSPSAAESAAAAALPAPLSLTENGIESLRTLSKHRPQRVTVGGIVSGVDGAAAPPAHVQLQIVSIHRYFIDQRFWALVGVPYPALPSAQSALPYGASSESKSMEIDDGNGANGSVAAASVAPSPNQATPAFDAYSDLNVAYDLVLTDGRQQVKALLSPTLSIHLEKGGLLPHGVIRVRDSTMRYDETVVGDRGFIVLRQIDILAVELPNLMLVDPAAPLTYPEWVDGAAMLAKPLIGGPRSYYLALFNDDSVYFDRSNYPEQGDAERVNAEQQQLLIASAQASAQGMMQDESKESAPATKRGKKPLVLHAANQDSVLADPTPIGRAHLTTIGQLLKQGIGYQPGDLNILCRVFAKSRINLFGRKAVSGGDRKDPLRAPFNFELLVGDSSGEQIKVVLWNTLVGNYFHRIHVGHIVLLRGFRLKQARSDSQYELALNPYNPIGSVRILREEEGERIVDPTVWNAVPPIVMTVSPISHIKVTSEESHFDATGVVTYAGPMLREWNSTKKQFFQYRWLLLVDSSCSDALPVKLFTNSQSDTVEGVQVADVLYLSNLTIRHVDSTDAPTSQAASRSILAHSTHYTQLLGPEVMLQSEHPYLKQLIDWSVSVDHGELKHYPSLFTWNLDYDHYKSVFGELVTPLREVPFVMDSLRYQQMRSVLVQVGVSDVILHPAGMRAVSDGVMNQEEYDRQVKRLIAIDTEEKQPEAAVSPALAAASPAAPAPAAASPAKRGRGRNAAEVAPSEVVMPQESTTSSRLRRSTRADTAATENLASQSSRRGRSKATVSPSRIRAASDGARSKSKTKSKKNKGSSKKKKVSGRRGSLKQQRAVSQPAVKKGSKTVKVAVRKRKASVTPEVPAPAPAAVEAAAPAAAVPAPAAVPSASSSPVASAPVVSFPHPSSPSTLATFILRDLNGEHELRVELQDPILGHVNHNRTNGSIASTCVTPKEAPRIFHGLAQILPASSFTPESWHAFIQTASAIPTSSKRGKKASAAVLSQSASRRAAIQQLYTALLGTLGALRLVASVQLTRKSYTTVQANLTSVFSAQP